MNCQDKHYGQHYRGVDPAVVARRWFLKECGVGLGAAALADLLGAGGRAETAPQAPGSLNPLAAKTPHFAPKAKRVIFLFMAGAPSHLELFDNKPQLAKFDGTLPPPRVDRRLPRRLHHAQFEVAGARNSRSAGTASAGPSCPSCCPSWVKWSTTSRSSARWSTDAFNHAPGQILMNTGSQLFGRPSFGAWTVYGLGSESQELPGFVVFSSGKKGPSGGNSNWGSGFLPTLYEGVQFRTSGDAVLYLSNPRGVDAALQRESLDTIAQLNRERLAAVGDPEIATRTNAFEMAFRMQASAPELIDVSQEPQHILDLYGCDPAKPSFAKNCLLARRLVERGVRFVQLFHEAWDQHGNLVNDLKQNCKDTDQACAALIQDLKQRGLLDDTLVIWGGEFGRTPMTQGGNDGRDHHPNAFTMWLAGGGIKPGITLGETDELGFNAVRDRVHVHDLHATLLHLLGFDHTKLTYRFQGRDFRLTDVHGQLVQQLLA